MGNSFARNVILVMTGLGVLCLSFWITLTIIDTGAQYHTRDVPLADVPLTNEDGSPRGARPSKVSDLPHPPIVPPFSVGWDGLEGTQRADLGFRPDRRRQSGAQPRRDP